MEVTCSRCHQVVPAESCFCPACGLPQLVYSAEGDSGPQTQQRSTETQRDASSIDWKRGMRVAIAVAVPAGLLSSEFSSLSTLFIFWMGGAAAWAVVLYTRSQRPPWITIGAGARIGLVTGLIAAWLAFGLSSAGLFVRRVVLHQGSQIDSEWRLSIDQSDRISQGMWKKVGFSDQQIQQMMEPQHNLMVSAEGHAGTVAWALTWDCLLFVLFAVAGGALSARTIVRQRPEA